MGRSFAYIGISPVKIFIGELTLVCFLLARPREVFERWTKALLFPSPLNGLALALLLFVLYGVFEVIRGIAFEYSTLPTIQTFIFNLYPLYIFLGFWAGTSYPDLLKKIVLRLSWWNGIYSVLYVVILNRNQLTNPFSPSVELFGQPGGSGTSILGVLSYSTNLGGVWVPLFLNAFGLLALQVRAEYLGVLSAMAVWAWLTRNLGRLAMGVGGLALLLTVGYLIDFSMPAPGGRGGTVSTQSIVGRALAPFDPDLAQEYSKDAIGQAGSVTWRKRWWAAIWENIHASRETTLIGHGYGFPLSGLVGYIKDETVRTPHNIFYYCLGYGGWCGVLSFFVFQIQIIILLFRAYRRNGQVFGILYWIQTVCMAFFSNIFETPFGAIPFYLLTGMAIAPLLAHEAEQRRTNPAIRAAADPDLAPLRS